MSINVSYHQLRKGDIVPDMLKKLEQFAMPPSSLTLELTESYFMKEEESRENVLDKLHGAGFTLAMDDFGMGYSSLLSLKNIPVDVVKIDRGFVKGITEDRFNAILSVRLQNFATMWGSRFVWKGWKQKKNTGRFVIPDLN